MSSIAGKSSTYRKTSQGFKDNFDKIFNKEKQEDQSTDSNCGNCKSVDSE